MTACKIFSTEHILNGLLALTGTGSYPEALASLAGTLVLDPRFRHLSFVIRSSAGFEPKVALYVFGEITPVDLERLRNLALQLMRVDRVARFVDYAEAERLSERLADLLLSRYSRRDLLGFEYRAIPRGGFPVMGMLSYALGVPGKSLSAGEERAERPLVLVDDCILSGIRFREQLRSLKKRPVILATLFAPEELQALNQIDGFPFECIAAETLQDLAPSLYGDGYTNWRVKWEQRMGDSALWIGQPEYLCFSWSEPESSFLNTVSGELEAGFRLAPPERCLRHRHLAGSEDGDASGHPEVQIHIDGPGPLTAAPCVVAAEVEKERGVIAVADFTPIGNEHESQSSPSELECYLFEGSASDMWRALIAEGSVEKALPVLAELYDADPSLLDADLDTFTSSLLERGLLVRG